MTQSFYDFPALYAALLPVDDSQWEPIARLLQHLGLAPTSVLDPACGPGGWLMASARHLGCRVAGNDIRPDMVALARAQMPSAEWVCGDMTDLRLGTGPFDLAVNLSSSAGHLPDDDAVVRHLASVRAHLAPGGAYLLEVTSPARDRHRAQHLWTSRKTSVDGGRARVVYRSHWINRAARQEEIGLELTTWDIPYAPRTLKETYILRTFPEDTARELAAQAGLHVQAALRTPPDSDDLLLVLRRDPPHTR